MTPMEPSLERGSEGCWAEPGHASRLQTAWHVLPASRLQQTACSRPPQLAGSECVLYTVAQGGEGAGLATTLQCDLGQFSSPSFVGNWAL